MTQRQRGGSSSAWKGLAGIGLEFAAAVGGFAALGWWIDRKYQTEPTALLICTGLGLVGGTYNLVKQSLAAAKRAERLDKNRPTEGEQDRPP
jgi:F0F1-type ATP synthase assembly protein I